MIINLGRQQEAQLRENGFTIPVYPETGKVSFGGEEVGFIDNFTGLVIRDEFEAAVKTVLELSRSGQIMGLGLWNIPSYI